MSHLGTAYAACLSHVCSTDPADLRRTRLSAEFTTSLQVESNPVMLYMKGTPAQPQCGFSKQVVSILHAQGEGNRTAMSAA